MIVSTDTPTSVAVHMDMTNEVYHAEKDHISRSTAHRFRGLDGGPSQWYVDTYGESLFGGNSATGFGTLVDVACEAEMRGNNWRNSVAVPPPGVLAADGSRRGKAYQEWRASLVPGAIECVAGDFVKVERIIASLRKHRRANELLEAATHTQYSVFWTDADGHRRKARADGVTQDCWFDLKTTSSEWRDLKWSFARFGYDWQAQWYSDSAQVAGFDPFVFPFIVVQTFPPFAVRVVTLTGNVLQRAADEIRDTLNLIRERRSTGDYFPEQYHDVVELDF